MITSTKNRQNYFIPATIAYMAILAYLQLRNPSGSGGAGISSVRQLLNNLAHIPAYAILTWLLLRNFLTVDFKAKVSAIAIAVENGMREALLILSEFNNETVPSDAVFILSKDFNAALAGTDAQRLLFESYLQGLVSIETYLKSLADAEIISIESTSKELEAIANDNFKPKPKVAEAPAMDNRTKSAISAGDK